jgi:hypothetical protein
VTCFISIIIVMKGHIIRLKMIMMICHYKQSLESMLYINDLLAREKYSNKISYCHSQISCRPR